MLKQWVSVTCTNCQRVIGYDDDSYKETQSLKCPYCKRWFYMKDAKIEVIPVKRMYEEYHEI